ncbi:MAG: GNAT family N-acetyltransferase [Acidobacteriaceae bacterium]|nr:GNAT family N-acetyltransferase [Acidobacteriaceae bacterium]
MASVRFEVRSRVADDDVFLRELFFAVKALEFAPLQLQPEVLTELLEMQYQNQQQGYASIFPNAKDCIVWVDDQRAGRLMLARSTTEMRIVDLALLESYRGQGVGGDLLQFCKQQAEVAQLPLCLSVRYNNPAKRLYERAGFVVQSRGDGVSLEMSWQQGESLKETPEEEEAASQANLPGQSSRYFKERIGQTLLACSENVPSVPLKLVEVNSLTASALFRNAGIRAGDSFELKLYGPREPLLSQDTVELMVPTGERFPLFLSPVGYCEEGVEYNILFNRMG